MKLPVKNGTPLCQFYNSKKEKIHFNEICNGSQVAIIAQLEYIVFYKQSFVIEFNALQMKQIIKREKKEPYIFNKYAMIDDDPLTDDDMLIEAKKSKNNYADLKAAPL